VDPVPDPLLLRKSGSAGDRTRDLCICSQKLWPLDHRGGHSNIIMMISGQSFKQQILYLQGEAAPGIKVYRRLSRPQPQFGQCTYKKNTFGVHSHQCGKNGDTDLSVAGWNQTNEIYSRGRVNILRGDGVCHCEKRKFILRPSKAGTNYLQAYQRLSL